MAAVKSNKQYITLKSSNLNTGNYQTIKALYKTSPSYKAKSNQWKRMYDQREERMYEEEKVHRALVLVRSKRMYEENVLQ